MKVNDAPRRFRSWALLTPDADADVDTNAPVCDGSEQTSGGKEPDQPQPRIAWLDMAWKRSTGRG